MTFTNQSEQGTKADGMSEVVTGLKLLECARSDPGLAFAMLAHQPGSHFTASALDIYADRVPDGHSHVFLLVMEVWRRRAHGLALEARRGSQVEDCLAHLHEHGNEELADLAKRIRPEFGSWLIGGHPPPVFDAPQSRRLEEALARFR